MREVEIEHRCRCVVIRPDPEHTVVNRCKVRIGPDEPFCFNCEDRHPEHELTGKIVTTTADVTHVLVELSYGGVDG